MSIYKLFSGDDAEQVEQVFDWLIVNASVQRRVALEKFESDVRAFKSCSSVKDVQLKVLEVRYYYWASVRSLILYLHSLGVIDTHDFHEVLDSTESRMNVILRRNGFDDCTFSNVSIPSVKDLFEKKYSEKSEVVL